MNALDHSTTDLGADDTADLVVVEYERGGVPIVSIGGEIDMSTTPELREILTRVASAGHDDVVLDLTDVTFLGSAGAVMLLGAASTLARRPMVLVAVDPAVRRPLQLLGVCSPITLCESIFEAVSTVSDARGEVRAFSDAG